MNSATPQPPLHDSPQGLSLRFCCVAPPSPAPCPCIFCFRTILVFFFRYGRVQARDGFLLREKLAEFKYGLGFAKTIFWGFGFGKTSAEFSRPQKGVWGMNAGGFRTCLFSKSPPFRPAKLARREIKSILPENYEIQKRKT